MLRFLAMLDSEPQPDTAGKNLQAKPVQSQGARVKEQLWLSLAPLTLTSLFTGAAATNPGRRKKLMGGSWCRVVLSLNRPGNEKRAADFLKTRGKGLRVFDYFV